MSLLFRSGLSKASSITLRARFSPEACAAPMMAMPLSVITVFTSAKSTLMYPGKVIISAMPLTATFNTSFALAKAADNVSVPCICCILSLSIIISESTYSFSREMPSLAFPMRFGPSKRAGTVTTPTVRMPISLATLAMTGAAPVPVPPPIAAVINTILVLARSMSSISLMLSFAAASPCSGRLPAPLPSVRILPNCIVLGTLLWVRI